MRTEMFVLGLQLCGAHSESRIQRGISGGHGIDQKDCDLEIWNRVATKIGKRRKKC